MQGEKAQPCKNWASSVFDLSLVMMELVLFVGNGTSHKSSLLFLVPDRIFGYFCKYSVLLFEILRHIPDCIVGQLRGVTHWLIVGTPKLVSVMIHVPAVFLVLLLLLLFGLVMWLLDHFVRFDIVSGCVCGCLLCIFL